MADGSIDSGDANPDSVTNRLVTKFPWTPREAFSTRSYWMIVIGGIACQFPFFFFTAHWLLHLKGAGIQAADAAWAMGLFTMGAVGGRLMGGWMMDRLAARFAFIMGLCCYFLGSMLALRVTPDALWIAYSAAILYGTGFGWTFVCLNTASGHYYGPRAFPKLNGMSLVLTAIFCSPAGVIGGKLFDIHGNYTRAIELNMVIAACGVVALFFATMPVPPTRGSLAELELRSAR
jgi:MFS family permease